MERLHRHISHTHSKIANFDVPLLLLHLCFKQHMIPTATISTPPTTAMTPMMMAKAEIHNISQLHL